MRLKIDTKSDWSIVIIYSDCQGPGSSLDFQERKNFQTLKSEVSTWNRVRKSRPVADQVIQL